MLPIRLTLILEKEIKKKKKKDAVERLKAMHLLSQVILEASHNKQGKQSHQKHNDDNRVNE